MHALPLSKQMLDIYEMSFILTAEFFDVAIKHAFFLTARVTYVTTLISLNSNVFHWWATRGFN